MLYEMTRRFRTMSSTRTDVRNGNPLQPHEIRSILGDLLAAATNESFANRSVAVNRGRPRDMMDVRVYVEFLWDEPESWDWIIQSVCMILLYYFKYGNVDEETGYDENGNKKLPLLFYKDGTFETCFCKDDNDVVAVGCDPRNPKPLESCSFKDWLKFAKDKRLKWKYLVHPEEFRCEFLDFLIGLVFPEPDETNALDDKMLDRPDE